MLVTRALVEEVPRGAIVAVVAGRVLLRSLRERVRHILLA